MALDYNHPIDVIEDIDLRHFEENYLIPQKPVILRGLLKGTKADRKSTRLNSSHSQQSRMPSSA